MARKQSSVLTDAELRPMEILWQRGPATVAQVTAALSESGILSYSTVLTTLRILERKGYVHHTKEGQAFVYHPVVERTQAQKSALGNLLSRFFDNSPELLVMNLLRTEKIDVEDLERIQRLIDEGDDP